MNKCINGCNEQPSVKVTFDNKDEWEYVCSDCFIQMIIEQLESRFCFEYEYIGKVKKLVRK